MAETKYLVGIDLGTTHTVVAYAEARGGPIEVFAIDQLIAADRHERRALLPSVLYAPLESERVSVSAHPLTAWPFVAGELARRRGGEIPGRMIASAKSWLCHSGVDRTAAILPWGEPDEGEEAPPKLSPLDASARYLAHVRGAWDAEFPEHPLASQDVVLTVPASFDEIARELTIEATKLAGLSVRLLEEPTAAFYAFLARGEDALSSLLDGDRAVAHVLVCDVGGGTTDLSLLAVRRGDRGLAIERVSVGDHLLLGGDNMDLALAHAAESRMGDPPLTLRQHGHLLAACREAKETLLGKDAPQEAKVTVLGAGSRLIGGARSAVLTREEVERIVLDGFFPHVAKDDVPAKIRGALSKLGLPFAREPAITKHIASFLSRSGIDADALLLNGGVFHAERARSRLSDAMSAWTSSKVRVLDHDDPDLAVARGAVAFARARRGEGTKIGGGSAHAYFVAVGEGSEQRAMCVVPQGAESGERHRAPSRLVLSVGRPARFALFASRNLDRHRPGDVIEITDDLLPLPPIATTLTGGQAEDVRVGLEGELTEVGTLDLACVEAPDGPRRFRLAFQIRESEPTPSMRPSARPRSASRTDEALSLVAKVFGRPKEPATPRDIKDLNRDLERVLGERSTWSLELARFLFDSLMLDPRARKRSPDHERQFWSLAGYALRPGFGALGDELRIAQIAPLFREGLTASREIRVWQQWLIAWRRIAAGLDEATSLDIHDAIDPSLGPATSRAKKQKLIPIEAHFEAMSLVSFLERVPPARKAALGTVLVERTWTSQDPRLWEALGRLGARVPAYASAHFVIGSRDADSWLDDLLREKWPQISSAPRAAWQLARRTGDRARDVGDRKRAEVAARLVAAGQPAWAEAVREVVAVEEVERAAQFGDSLPVGLRIE